MYSLPPNLITALESLLEGQKLSVIGDIAQELSAGYRAGQANAKKLDAAGTIAYALSRLPSTFFCIRSALSELQSLRPDLAPVSFLDIGAGPGTGLWAAAETWSTLETAVELDQNKHFLALGQRLANHAGIPVIRSATWVESNLRHRELDPKIGPEIGPKTGNDKYDVVLAAFMLNEMPDSRIAPLIDSLWSRCNDTLVIVEPGTPAAFPALRQARETLVASGAHIIAPCSHNESCPLENDWCHFVTRFGRPQFLKSLKGGSLPYEDANYAYIAASRVQGSAYGGRVIRKPRHSKPGIHLDVCADGEIRNVTRARSDAGSYKAAKKLKWGDRL